MESMETTNDNLLGTEVVEIAPVTLEQLAVSLGIGSAILAVTLLLFAGALRLRITHIAPRCEARPRNVIHNPDPECDASQRRGNPFLLGWLFWLFHLNYHTLIEGVPGTGTRKGGLAGHLLKVNLDGIVLLRFHAMALRISAFAMFVYCCLCLPVYRTARCYDFSYHDAALNQNCTFQAAYNLTRYEKLTLANVPSLNEADDWGVNATIVTLRLYMVVLCTYFVCWYTCYELHKEWIDLHAMRRIYYLERDHWRARRKELKATMLQQNMDASQSAGSNFDDNPHLHQREVWIPHPEQRDTPPSIELYSVLVGGLPNRPLQAVSEEDLEAALSDDHNAMDWQLSVTSAFFDYCVPNQPGFSSSVAAVTILPSASELALAWSKWYRAVTKLQRLRLIRRTLRARGHCDEHEPVPTHDDEVLANGEGSVSEEERVDDTEVPLHSSSSRAKYTRSVLGSITDEDVEEMFLKALNMGPEQTAVYSIELANGSSLCCPHGCCEEKILWSNIETLLEMEEHAAREAHDAFLDLESARKKVAAHDRSEDLGTGQSLLRISSHLWFGRSQGWTADSGPASQSVELTLFGKGRATLEAASHQHQQQKEKTSKHGNGQGNLKQQEGRVKSKLSAVSGPPVRPDLRPRNNILLKSEFSSLVLPSVADGFEANTQKGREKEASFRSSNDSAIHPWEMVTRAANESEKGASETGEVTNRHIVSDGIWYLPSPSLIWKEFWKQTCGLFVWTVKSSDLATDLMARDSTFAVVTFTSRQAAIAARKCLADGRGAGRWTTIDELPVPPLADSSAFNICDCRGCCRPVTVTLNDHQKTWRNYAALTAVIVIYVGYTYPITISATFGSKNAARISQIVPSLQLDSEKLFGFIRAQLLNLFLTLCPTMFLAIANFGSNATSMVGAEFAALQYYWWFFLLFALLGSSILQMVLRAFEEGSFNIKATLATVAATIPSQVSSNWTNWIILKATIFHPLSYLLQLSSFLLGALNLKCCVRLVRGGGDGASVPYRFYVESGMVLMFVLALAPAAPILSPFAVMYFVICNPILRHILIFTYKPQWDGGGIRFPFLFDMVISSMVVSEVLLSMMLILKNANGPAVIAFLLLIPTLFFRRTCLKRFLGAYHDAALLQTSLLDGWDTNEHKANKTAKRREEFRQFLVDAHKAAYVPVCLAGTNTDKILTAEPAVVVPTSDDIDYEALSSPSPAVVNDATTAQSESSSGPGEKFLSTRSQQFGAVMRRGSLMIPPAAARLLRTTTKEAESGGDGLFVRGLSLGSIRLGPDGEMYITENKGTSKDE